jgi:class 3 adenylate cyclase/DNA-binding CsgD family transcriptional regulator
VGVAGLPSGVVTFVLTDVVGSTELWERRPESMAEALARHEAIVAAAVTAEGGTVLKAKGEGDSTFSVFARASDALRAAYRLQAGMRGERWPAGAEIRTRVAVDTGEAIERDGDFFGAAVSRVARLRGLAGGGDILVGAATAAITRRDLPAGCELVDLGPVALRGLDHAEPAFALAGPGLDPIERLPSPDADRPTPADFGVSRREAEVLALLGEKLTNAEIATRLYISERTVESHVSALLRKLGAGDRHELVRRRSGDATAGRTLRPAARLPAPLELLADPSSFVGRVAERQALRQRWELARAGHTLIVLVTGEAGMGKSRLVSELAAEVHGDGGRVLFGACYEDTDQPYGPFIQALAAEAADVDPTELRRRLAGDGDVLVPLSSDLERALGPPGRRRDDQVDASERGVVLDAIERWLRAGAEAAPTLIVLEDIHWSSATTRDVFRHLARRAGRQPILVVATTRDSAPDLDADLDGLIAELQRSPAVWRVSLTGLDREEVATLADVDAAEAESIIADTGGNPLLVTHATDDRGHRSLPAFLARRDRLLDDDTRAVLDLAATFGSEFEADLLAAGTGAPLLTLLDALEKAEAAGLVVALPGRGGRFGFVHALFRSHRYDSLPRRRRMELHARASAALGSLPDTAAWLSERARHACLAVPVGDARNAVHLATEAGELAEHAYAYDEAAGHYRRGLDASRSLDPPDPGAALELTIRLGAALHHHGDPHGLPMLYDAARRAQELADEAALVRVATSFSQFGALNAFLGPPPAQSAIVEEALAVLGPDPSATRAHLLIALAGLYGFVRVDETVEWAREAEAIARQLGDDDVLGHVLLGARHVAYHPSRLEEYERIGAELVQLGHRTGALAFTLAGENTLAWACLQRGDLDGWRRGADRLERRLGDRSLPFFQLDALVHRAQQAILEGRLADAEAAAESMRPLAAAVGHPAGVWHGAIVLVNRRLQARDVELRASLERLVQRGGEVSNYRSSLAAVQARSGATDDALGTLAGLRADGYPAPRSYPWTLTLTELVEAAEVAGDPDAAAHVLAEAGPYSGRIALSGPCLNRPFDQVLAQAALAVGDNELAEGYARKAVEASRRWRAPVFLVRDLVFLAEARRRNGAAVDEVRPLVAEALAVAQPIGAGVAEADVERYGLPR